MAEQYLSTDYQDPKNPESTSIDFNEQFPDLINRLAEKQQKYKEAYEPAPYIGKEKDPNYFFLSLEAYQEIIDQMPAVRSAIIEELSSNNPSVVEKWKQGIESILFKALISESIKYGQWIAEDIAKENSQKEHLQILELCTGAGITTTMLYLERLNQSPEASTQIISVDNSFESIACASLVASSLGIQCKVCTPESLDQVSEEFNGIVYVIDDAAQFTERLREKNIHFDTVVSDNGISYFPEEIHKDVLSLLHQLYPESPLYISSLKNGKSVELGLPFKIQGIIQGSRFLIKESEQQYDERNGIIVKTYTPETRAFFYLANRMLHNKQGGIKDLRKLLSILSSATKSSQDLNSAIESPVSYTKEVAEQIGLSLQKNFPESEKAPCEVGVFI